MKIRRINKNKKTKIKKMINKINLIKIAQKKRMAFIHAENNFQTHQKEKNSKIKQLRKEIKYKESPHSLYRKLNKNKIITKKL